MAVYYQGSVEGTEIQERWRTFWNDCLIRWKRPVSSHEEATLARLEV